MCSLCPIGNVAIIYDYPRRCTEHSQGSFHCLSVPPTKEDFSKFHTPWIFKSFVILGLQSQTTRRPSEYHIVTLLLNPLDLFFVDFETLRILTSSESKTGRRVTPHSHRKKLTRQPLGFSLKIAIWEPL